MRLPKGFSEFEEKEYQKVQRMIEKNDKKSLDKWLRDFCREEKRDLKEYTKKEKDDFF